MRLFSIAALLLLLLSLLLPPFVRSFLIGPQLLSPSSHYREPIIIRTFKTPPFARLHMTTQEAQWQSHISTHMNGLSAVDKLLDDVTHLEEMDLAFLFVGQAHASEFEAMVTHAYQKLIKHGCKTKIQLISIIGGGVIGENVEIDDPQRPGVSLLLGPLPEGAEVRTIEYSNSATDVKDNKKDTTWKLSSKYDSCLVFCDPWAPVENILQEYLYQPGRVVAGGISCPYLADQSSVAINDRLFPQGSMIGVAFAGNLGLQTMVAQGCRPIASGRTYKITACEGNLVTGLDGQPALELLQQLANTAPPEEQEQITSGLLCGVAKASSCGEDFLSRQIMGFAPSLHGIAIATTNVEVGDHFCFQVRDGKTVQQDLQLMVQRTSAARLFDNTDSDAKSGHPVAALQISCVARGRGMFAGLPNVDVSNVMRLLESPERGPVVGGFFANGEIGPVGLAGFSTTVEHSGNSYLHSFTTVAAILCKYTTEDHNRSSRSAQTESLDAWG